MTDNEIIEEFEVFIKYSAPERLMDDVLDLINRQKAEIERLQGFNDNLIASNTHISNNLLDEIDKAKVEAVKEFAEQVKMAFYYQFDELIPSIMADKIDDLVKEMVGDNDESTL